MSQDRLATNLVVSRQTITKWETDTAVPDTVHVKRLANMFGITVDSLLDKDADYNITAVRESIDLADYEKMKGYTLKDTVVFKRFGDGFAIYGLTRMKSMSIMEQIIDFIVAPGTIELADQFSDLSRFYYVEGQGVRLIVNVTNDEIITQELADEFIRSKVTIGKNKFKKSPHTIDHGVRA